MAISDERLLPEFRKLPTVTDVSLLSIVGDSTDLSALDDVQVARFSIYSGKMRSLSAIRSWPCVTTLGLADCGRLRDISQLSLLHNLENLYIGYCPNLKDYIPIARLENLREAELSGMTDIDLSVFTDLQQLARLKISLYGRG